jgi:hypothetical protein
MVELLAVLAQAEPDRARRAYHEAAHAIAAQRLGLRVTSVTLDDPDYAGAVRFRPCILVGEDEGGVVTAAGDEVDREWLYGLANEAVGSHVESQVVMWAAGAAGETLYESDAERPPLGVPMFTNADNALVRSALTLLEDDPKERPALEKALRDRATALIADANYEVRKVAVALLSHGYLDTEALHRALG